MTDRDAFSLKIPAFLRGELSPEEMAEIEVMAAEDLEFSADIEFQKALRLSLKEGAEPDMGLEFGWARLSKAIEADVEPPIEAANDRAPTRIWQYAAALLASIVVGQAVFMGSDKGSDDQYVMAGNAESAVSISVTLNAQATTKSLTNFLTTYDGVLTAGPDAAGQYRIAFADAKSCDAAQEQLNGDSEIVEIYTACGEE